MIKVLVIRFSSIGDIVLTTPVVRVLKEQAGAEVHFLTKAAFRSILEPNPYIDRVYTIKKKVKEVLPQLRQEGYHYIFDLHRNLRSLQVKLGLYRVPHYSFDKLNWEKWLLVKFKIDRLPANHIVDRYLATTRVLKLRKDGGGLDYFIPEEEEVDTDRFIQSGGLTIRRLSGKESAELPYTAFVIGAAHATKRLPQDRIIDWCRRIPGPVILLGGPEDAGTGAAIAGAAGSHVFTACGRCRLHQSASIVRQSQLVITHDTGLMHIAAAFRKEIWSVWGNTVPALGMYPYYPEGVDRNRTFEVPGLSCRPCSKIGYSACPKGHFRCMRDISFQIPGQE